MPASGEAPHLNPPSLSTKPTLYGPNQEHHPPTENTPNVVATLNTTTATTSSIRQAHGVCKVYELPLARASDYAVLIINTATPWAYPPRPTTTLAVLACVVVHAHSPSDSLASPCSSVHPCTPDLLPHLVHDVATCMDGGHTTTRLQSSFDLLAELIKFNRQLFHNFNKILCADPELYEKLCKTVCGQVCMGWRPGKRPLVGGYLGMYGLS